MNNFDPKDKRINNDGDETNVKLEINSNYSKVDHRRGSAEPNTGNIVDIDSDETIKNLNSNNSQGGK